MVGIKFNKKDTDLAAAMDNLHLAIRAGIHADPFGLEKLEGDVIWEHNEIAKTNQLALFGKLGRKPMSDKLDLLRNSIKTYGAAQLIVIRRMPDGYEAFAAPLKDIFSEDNFSPDISLVPSYYHYLIPEIKLWFCIGVFSRMPSQRLESLSLLSNKKSLIATVMSCRTSMMFVLEGAK